MEICPDPEGLWTVEEMSLPPLANRFRPPGEYPVKFDIHHKAIWVRFTLQSPPAGPDQDSLPPEAWILSTGYPFFHSISLYTPTATGFRRVTTGGTHPWSSRDVSVDRFAFRLPRGMADATTFYLRLSVASDQAMTFSIWRGADFLAWRIGDNALLFICYGALMAMILTNLFIALMVRSMVYVHYVGYVASSLCLMLLFHSHLGVFVRIPSAVYSHIFWLIMGLFTSFAYLFMRSFLGTRYRAPLIDKFLLVGAAYGVLIFAADFIHPLGSRWLSILSGFVSPWLAILAGVVCLWRGYRPSIYFLTAWGILGVSVLIAALNEVGILPPSDLAQNAMALGTTVESLILSLALGARIRSLKREKETLAQSAQRFRDLSITDSLTGLYNRRYFLDQLEGSLDEGRESGEGVCLLMLDVDDFKSFNDGYGHDQGDLVLAGLSRVIEQCVRKSDIPCRWGGEEFAVILPSAGLPEAAQAGERIRLAFQALTFHPEPGMEASRTVSLGAAQALPGEGGESLLRRADQALYRAKREGKNRLELAA